MEYILYQTTMIPNLPQEGGLKIEESMIKPSLKWRVTYLWTGSESHAIILICSGFLLYH